MTSDPLAFLARLAREHRQADRLAANSQRVRATVRAGYEAGRVNRLNQNWLPGHYSADAAIAESASLTLARARDLVRNDEIAAAAVQRFVEEVVGPNGIDIDAAAKLGDELDEDFNAEADEAFMEWWDEADITETQDFPGLQELALREVIEAGECLILECADNRPGRSVPLCYQLISAEQLDDSRDQPRGNGTPQIRRGVELDRFNRPVAYWLLTDPPHDTFAGSVGLRHQGDSIRYPAHRVQHLFFQKRVNQTRGVTWFATVIRKLRDLGWYTENELTSSAIGALFGVIIKSDAGASSPSLGLNAEDQDETDEDGNYLENLSPGLVARVHPGEDVVPFNSNRNSAAAEPWINLLVQIIAMGLGHSRLSLTKDFRQTNYSAARGNELMDRRLWRRLQNWYAPYWKSIRQRWTEQAVALGVIRSISPLDLARERRRWLRVVAQPPGWDWVDPVKEMTADKEAISSRLANYKDTMSRRGLDWRDVWRQAKREELFAKRLGLVLPSAVSAKPNPPPPQGDEEEDEEKHADQDSSEEE